MSKTVLIVDDEEDIRSILRDEFELNDWDVTEAGSGNAADQILKDKTFDLVVSDIRMPDGDGEFLLKSIRGRDKEMPVVVMITGFADMTAEDSKGLGANAYITKPFDAEKVYEQATSFLKPD